MARQVGIHQIKGRYGTTSYYFRKRAKSGFLRSINQELSERVKTAENYAGTRIQNADFKLAMACSWCITSGWETLKKFYLYGDMSARLAAFFRQHYVPYIGTDFTVAQQERYLSMLASWFNTLQKNNAGVLSPVVLSPDLAYQTNPTAKTYSFSGEIRVLFGSDVLNNLLALYGGKSVVEFRFFSVNYEGKVIPQLSYLKRTTLLGLQPNFLAFTIDESGSLLVPHLTWDGPLFGYIITIELTPVVNDVKYLSRSICRVFTGYVK